MITVGIVGGTGYTGVELLRLLACHPKVCVRVITSRSEAGLQVAEQYPNLRGYYDKLVFSAPDMQVLKGCDLVFFATPHGVAHALAKDLLDAGTRVIDLSADFRLKDPAIWSYWYGQPHGAPELLAEAVYGLPETNREQIRGARLIAVPGCYPTATQLGLLPLLEQNLAAPTGLIASCASGISGAGRTAKIGSLFCETSDTMMAYAVQGHRHLPEIEQELSRAARQVVGLTFVPHLVPMGRGIHASLYATVSQRSIDLQQLFEERYAHEPFVDVLPAGAHPATRTVRGSNFCRIAVYRPQDSDTVVVLCVIDNLVKGAAGQAIQNMNILFELDERTGLEQAGLLP